MGNEKKIYLLSMEKEPQLNNQNIEADSNDKITEMETKVQELISEIAADVFKKARETKGQERLGYVRRLKRFGETVGPEQYSEILRGLMTNEAAIDELERLGLEELLKRTKNKFKRWIPWKK